MSLGTATDRIEALKQEIKLPVSVTTLRHRYNDGKPQGHVHPAVPDTSRQPLPDPTPAAPPRSPAFNAHKRPMFLCSLAATVFRPVQQTG